MKSLFRSYFLSFVLFLLIVSYILVSFPIVFVSAAPPPTPPSFRSQIATPTPTPSLVLEDSTKRLFIPVESATDIHHSGKALNDNDDQNGFAQFRIPNDFTGTIRVFAVLHSTATGDANIYFSAIYSSIGRKYNENVSIVDFSSYHFDNEIYTLSPPLDLAHATAGDYGTVFFQRDATEDVDTLNGTLYLHGFVIYSY